MSFEITKKLLSKNKKIKKIAIVGGVGYVNKLINNVKIDDIFIPLKLTYGDDKNGYCFKTLENHALNVKNNIFDFKNKKINYGFIKTVVPRIGVVSNTELIKKGISSHVIDALDMELEGFLNGFSNCLKIDFFGCYYIMDIPHMGLGLGNTYYNIKFLEKLFSNFERGKYVCLERSLNFLIK